MTTGMVYDLVNLATLTQYVRQWEMEVLRPEGRVGVLEQILPNQEVLDLEYAIRKGGLLDVDAAHVRAWDTPVPLLGRQGVKRIRGSMVPFGQGILLGEEEAMRVRRLQEKTDNPLIAQIYDDAELTARSVAIRVELARGDVINDGKFTVSNENGLSFEADYGRSSWASPTASTLWSDATNSTPLSDLLAWCQLYLDNNGIEVGSIWIPKATRRMLALNAEFRSYEIGRAHV